MTPLNKAIKFKGLVAPVVAIHIFNSNWTTAFNQTYTNSPDSITVSNLSAQTYHVKVTFYTSGWASICEKMQDVAVTSTGDAATTEYVMEAVERSVEITARSIAVAPNPFVNSLNLTIGSTKSENASLSIMDMSGRQVYTRSVSLQKGYNRFSLNDMKNLRTGSYFLRLVTSEGVQTIRLIRQ
jgi:hypothetical protein